jgi:hypothetical protein
VYEDAARTVVIRLPSNIFIVFLSSPVVLAGISLTFLKFVSKSLQNVRNPQKVSKCKKSPKSLQKSKKSPKVFKKFKKILKNRNLLFRRIGNLFRNTNFDEFFHQFDRTQQNNVNREVFAHAVEERLDIAALGLKN